MTSPMATHRRWHRWRAVVIVAADSACRFEQAASANAIHRKTTAWYPGSKPYWMRFGIQFAIHSYVSSRLWYRYLLGPASPGIRAVTRVLPTAK